MNLYATTTIVLSTTFVMCAIFAILHVDGVVYVPIITGLLGYLLGVKSR